MPSSLVNSQLVVVIEDDDSLREMMCELLQLDGFKTFGCRSGADGLRAIRDLHPSVVTLDLHMPGMDGLEVLDSLSRNEATSRVPVIVVSAYASDRRVRCSSQVKAVIQKPFEVDDLCNRVRRAANDQAWDRETGRLGDLTTPGRGDAEALGREEVESYTSYPG